MNQNTYMLLAKIIIFFLIMTVSVTCVYGINVYSKKDVDILESDAKKISNKEVYTEIIQVSDICETNSECDKDVNLKLSNDKSVSISFKKFINSDETFSNSLKIDGKDISIKENSEIFEFGIFKSKYYVVSFKGESKTFYYLDELLREVKKVNNVEDSALASFSEYNYYVCKQSDDGVIKSDYRMNIDESGTFVSTIVNTGSGICN